MKSLQTEQSVTELVHGKINDAALRNLCAVTSVLPTLRSLRAQWVISLVARAIGTREGTQHRQLLANKAAACAAHSLPIFAWRYSSPPSIPATQKRKSFRIRATVSSPPR